MTTTLEIEPGNPYYLKAAIRILNQEDDFRHSNNSYDWLGNGIYFWENNYQRAIQYALEDSERANSSIRTPFVLGAVLEDV